MKMMKRMKNNFLVLILFIFISGLYAQSALSNFDKAMEYQSQEEYYIASQYYLEVVSENPAFTDAWYNLSLCSYKVGEFNLALNYLETAKKYKKEDSKILNLQGLILTSLGREKEAKEIFMQILKRYPNDVDAHFGLAELELLEGRFSGAELEYNEALKRQSKNRKALLSLALVNAECQNYKVANNYLKKACSYYSGDAEVHYLAGIIYSMQGNFDDAEKHARISVELNPNLEKSYNLLSNIVYNKKDYDTVINISDFLISRNRKNSNAWYIKGVAQSKLGNSLDAIETWSKGLSVNPQDELMRFAMELEIRENLNLEDHRRKHWAQYHLDNARQYNSRYENSGAVYEYQRALLLDPLNFEARMNYARILELNGMHELYLEQLNFIQQNCIENLSEKEKRDLQDTIEAYNSLLTNTIGKKWNVEAFYLDKTRWNIAIFYEANNSSFIHVDTNNLLARAAADIFSGVAITSVKTQINPIKSYSDAFNNARKGNYDYFIILSLNEAENDLTLKSTMYSARTGLEVSSDKFYATGNNRFSSVLRRFRSSVLEKLTVRGKILKRNGKNVLIDLGKSENIVKDAKFKIIKKGQIRTADSGPGLTYRDDDVLGYITVTNCGEEISEGILEKNGFYDRINEEDEIVLMELPASNVNNQANGNAIDTVPAADESGNALVTNASQSKEALEDIRKAVERPSILELLRDIY